MYKLLKRANKFITSFFFPFSISSFYFPSIVYVFSLPYHVMSHSRLHVCMLAASTTCMLSRKIHHLHPAIPSRASTTVRKFCEGRSHHCMPSHRFSNEITLVLFGRASTRWKNSLSELVKSFQLIICFQFI